MMGYLAVSPLFALSFCLRLIQQRFPVGRATEKPIHFPSHEPFVYIPVHAHGCGYLQAVDDSHQ